MSPEILSVSVRLTPLHREIQNFNSCVTDYAVNTAVRSILGFLSCFSYCVCLGDLYAFILSGLQRLPCAINVNSAVRTFDSFSVARHVVTTTIDKKLQSYDICQISSM